MTQPASNIKVFENGTALADAACHFIIQQATESIAARGRFTLSLSGGNTPEQMFRLMAAAPFTEAMPWKDTFFFWGDERCVPLDDASNNANKALELLLSKVPVPAENIFRIPVNLEPAEAATVYESTIKKFFGTDSPVFDLILLGLGENGHTASLFPGTDVLEETDRLVKEVYVAEVSMYRVTMTAPLINAAAVIVFLAAGPGKTDVLHTVLEGDYDPEKYPAQMIYPADGKLLYFLDKDAAAKLKL